MTDDDFDVDEDFQVLREVLVNGSQRVQQEFDDPDDDWAPIAAVLLSEREEDGPKGVLVGIDPAMLRDDKGKDQLAAALAQLSRMKPRAMAMLTSAWSAVRYTDDEDDTAPSDDPQRMESLLATAVHRCGEQRLWSAAILRDGENPPELDEWSDGWGGDSSGVQQVAGRFPDALKRAVSDWNEEE